MQIKSKYLISIKSTGLSYNIIRLIVLSDLAKKYDRQLIFLTKADHIPILKKFNNNCTYIPYVPGHTDRFNSFKRNQHVHLIYDLNYKNFLKTTYISNIITDIEMSDIKHNYGRLDGICNSSHSVILAELCSDLEGSVEAMHKIKCKNFTGDCKYNKNVITINILVHEINNKRVFEYWDELIPVIKKEYGKPILLISGNNDIKKYLGDKHECLYEIKETETKYSFRRNSDTIRGRPDQLFNDLIICKNTHFISCMQILKDYPTIVSKYNDISFLGMPEHFDIVASYMSN